jgi:hypothetical protein
MTEKLSSLDEIHQEIDSEVILKDIVHGDDERVLNVIKNFFFKLEAVKEILFEDDVFSDGFHSINLLVYTVLDKENFAKGTFSKHFLDLKILEPYSFFGQFSFTSKYETASMSHGCTSCRW